MKNKLLSLIFISIGTVTFGQTQFWSDNFEVAGSPSSGTRTPSVTVSCGGPPATAYFANVTTADISTGTVYTGFSGSKFWAIEDIDKGPTCVNNSVTAHQNITWSGINIAGKAGLSFKGLFAVGSTTAFDGFGIVQSAGTSVFDYLIIQSRIDAGAWTDVIRFFPSINNSGSGTLAVETTGDSIAQGEGTGLTTVATEFSGNIVGTGTTLQLRALVWSNSAAEEILLDNFRVFYASALPVTISSFSSSCDENDELISWISESENRLDHYTLEYSTDLEEFKTMATIPAKGESSDQLIYNYKLPLSLQSEQLLYYRLKMVDLDGTVNMMSPISSRQCQLEKAADLLKSFSYSNQQLQLVFNDPNVSIELFTPSGQSIIKPTDLSNQHEFSISLTHSKPQVFILKISNSDQSKTCIKRLFL